MRALCEACDRPQPVDWKPGDLCIHCGQAVRREARCFWCVKWTPAAGKYCRTCGAAVVEDRLFGAARMLKDAGVDRFGVPKMLADLDPDQIENFTNIYQRHAAVMNRHVDHVRFLESFLQHTNWSEVLEDELIAELPWPEERLKTLSPPLHPDEHPFMGPLSRAKSLALARAISAVTTLLLTRTLAPLVRLLLEDWQVHREAQSTLYTSDPLIKGEAALALTNWRVVYGPGILEDRYGLMDALRECPFKYPAAVHLAMMGAEGAELPPEALVSDDPDIAFTAALAVGDIDRLVAAERDTDPLKRYAAAYRLIKLGEFTGLGDVIRQADEAQQLDLLNQIGYKKKPVPALRDVFYEILETSPERAIRDAASDRIRQCWEPGDTLRIARHAQGDSLIYQGLLKTPAIPPEELVQLCRFLLDNGAFSAGQWGMPDIAKEGRLPPTFVPRHWADASEATRVEMCKFAETQLENYGDEELHRFLVSVVFGSETFAVQHQAWVSLFRWYGRTDYTAMGPLRIETASLQRFFGSVAAFVPILSRVLGNGTPPRILDELFVREPLAKLLRHSDPNVLPHLTAELRPALQLTVALKGVTDQPRCDLMLRLACIDLLVMMAEAPELRKASVRILTDLRHTDLDLAATTGLERIAKY
jgi:hypothetical protein